MHQELIEQIDRSIELAREDLKSDIIRLISVKSVKGTPEEGAPFGRGPRNMLNTVFEMGKAAGFETTDYNVGVVSLGLQAGQPDLGIWLHGDVVPEGEGWLWSPYEATEYEGCIIGRGATDNKGQLCAIFHLLKIFKEMNIPLRYNPALYVGSNEETGMEDVQAFLKQHTPPRLSLVPDSSFPVGYGGKGALHITFRSQKPFSSLTITAGQPESAGKAVANLYGRAVVAHSPPRHGANPDPNGNMITMLTTRLLEEPLDEQTKQVLAFFRRLSLDIHGDTFGINRPCLEMTPLTVFAQRIDMDGDYPALTVNIRYPVGITADEIVQRMEKEGEAAGLSISQVKQGTEPYLLDKTTPVIRTLTEIANQITGDDKPPYTLAGTTYAHRLPNALAFGMDGCLPPEGYPKGRGSAHGLDELVSLDRLQRAMRIYARAMLSLNEMEW